METQKHEFDTASPAQSDEKPTHQQATWSPEQLAVMLHVSVRKIHQAISSGHLMAEKTGNHYAISQKAISEFVKTGNPFAKT
jgi:excisionase family DNA binding protein